jgi:hypothetical protein
VEKLSPEQRDSWRLTGNLPEAPAEAAPAKTDEKPVKTEPKAGAEPVTAKPKHKTAEERKAELKAEIESIARKKAEAKTEFEEFENWKKAKGSDGKPAESSTAAATEPKVTEVREPQPPERPKRPRMAEFPNDLAAYEAAMDKYDEAMLAYPPTLHAYETAKAQNEKAKADILAFNKKVEEGWKTKVATAQEKHGDFNDVAFDKTLGILIPQGGPIDHWLFDSDHGAELLYHFGKNRDELKRITALNWNAQNRELAKLEETLFATAEPKETEEEEKPEPKKVTAAGKVTSEVGGRATVDADPVKAASARKNFAEFRKAANERDLARRKRG